MSSRPRLLFLVTEDWYFCSHRLPLAVAARDAGYDVSVATRVSEHGGTIREAGIGLFPIALSRRSLNPLRELRALMELVRLYRRVQPDLVHHVAVKPVIYGSIAARLTGVPWVINALTGLGYVFTSTGPAARFTRPILKRVLRYLVDRTNTRFIVQNQDDLALLLRERLVDPARAVLIRGSGVDLALYGVEPEPPGPPLVILPARMLRHKGVREFVEAAQRLKTEGIAARFALVGGPDAANPASIHETTLRAWANSGAVEYWGWRDHMARVLAQCHVVCLPSYREGLPKALIEAAACGRAIVTCDVPGCREVVHPADRVLLVPPRDSTALAAALRRLIESPSLRQATGKRNRERAAAEFSVERVVEATLVLYHQLAATHVSAQDRKAIRLGQ